MKYYACMSGLPGCMPDFMSDGHESKQSAYETLAQVWDVSPSTMRRWVNEVYPKSDDAMGCTFSVHESPDFDPDAEYTEW